MKKKDIFMYAILIILSLLVLLLIFQVINISEKYNELQTASSKNLNTVQTELSSTTYSSKVLENEINTLKTENVSNQYDNTINSIKEEINELKSKYNSLPNYSKDITNLEKKTNLLENNYLSSTKIHSNIIRKWKTTVETEELSDESHTINKITCTTKYEFKSNGDFYINENKVGIFADNYIFFKDANDEQYRTANYYYIDNNLYLNLFATTKDIIVSTSFYNCEKI